MAKRLFSTTYGLIYAHPDETPTYHLTVTDQLITFRVTAEFIQNNETQNVTVHEWKLPWSVVNEMGFKSNTLIGIIAPPTKFNKEFLTPTQVVNLSEATKAQKSEFSASPKVGRTWNSPIHIFIRNPNLGFTQQDIILLGEPNTILDTTETFEYYEAEGKNNTLPHLELVDKITVSKDTTYTDPDYTKYNVSSEDYVDVIYLESINGICDKSRVYLTNGSGSFRVLNSSVESGTKVKVKLGFATYHSMTELNELL
jgi:hypothetical protein